MEEPSRHPVGGKCFKLVFEPMVRMEVRVRVIGVRVKVRATATVKVRRGDKGDKR